MMKFRRRRYIVSSGFQWRFVVGFISVALTVTAATAALFNFFALKRLEELRWSAFVTAQSTSEALQPLFIHVTLFSALLMTALLLSTGAWMLRKMNGPIYNIMKGLKQIVDGNLSSSFILRRKDEFRDVAEVLNEMLDRTRGRFRTFRTGQEEISKALIGLEIALANGDPIEEKGERIIGMVHELRKETTTQ